MRNAEDIVVIKPKKQNPLFLILMFLLVSFSTYLHISQIVQHPDRWGNWFQMTWIVLLWIFLIIFIIFKKKLSQSVTLKLIPEGLMKGTTLYKWHDIECFGITKESTPRLLALLDRKTIYWNYKPSSLHRKFSQKLSKFLIGFDYGVHVNYEVGGEELVKMLNDWKIRYTGQPSDIKYGGGLNRNLTNKEFILIGGGLIIFLILFFTILTAYFNRSENIESHNKTIQRMRNTPR